MDVNIFPVSVNDYEPAFLADSGVKIHFSLSSFTNINTIQSIHVTVTKQGSNQNMLKATDSNGRYRSNNGILIIDSSEIQTDDEGLYIQLTSDDVKFSIGTLYKAQIRVSTVGYSSSLGLTQTSWLNLNSTNFSEWSKVCILKCTGEGSINSPLSVWNVGTRMIDTVEFTGTYSNEDPSESLYSYHLQLLKNGSVVETSEEKLAYNNELKYNFETTLTPDDYAIIPYTTTINRLYTEHTPYTFTTSEVTREDARFKIYASESNEDGYGTFLTPAEESDKGIVSLLVYDELQEAFSGDVFIRRTDSNSGFQEWEDIITLHYDNAIVSEYVVDKTTESDVYYKYSVQYMEVGDTYRSYSYESGMVKRQLEYMYILGEDGKQLTMMFDATINGGGYNQQDGQLSPIGSKYPYVTRSGKSDYVSTSLNAIISFNQDEEEFVTDEELFGPSYALYADRSQYNHFRERKFREYVINWLKDGKPKLYRTSTEGNMIVALTNISFTPNQTISRMIGQFSATMTEIDEVNIENYKFYGFLEG